MPASAPMLRITIASQASGEAVLRVEGWVVREGVTLLANEVQRWLDQGQRVVLDLDGVRFIDRAGLELLGARVGTHLALRGGSPFIRAQLRRRGLGSSGSTGT